MSNVDVLRVQLEAGLVKLRNALKHWQTCEAEYEGLKEELKELPPDHTSEDVIEIGRSYEGVLPRKEVLELLGADKESSTPRKVTQILGLLDRRNDYVQKNIETLKKQLEVGEEKLEKVTEISSEARTEEGLPITDIYEELDEDGNVISGRTSRPNDAKSHILQALKKAGLKEEDLKGNTPDFKEQTTDDVSNEGPTSHASPARPSHSPDAASAVAESTVEKSLGYATSRSAADPSTSLGKSISSANNPQSYGEAPLPTGNNIQPASIPPASPTMESAGSNKSPSVVSELANGLFKTDERVVELDSDDEIVGITAPKAPINESAEDALLRRQMIEYNMREMGNIVAQLDLEEGEGSGTDYDEDIDYDFDEDDEDEDGGDRGLSEYSDAEDEDQYGLSRNGIMTEEYIKEMQALERRLKARMFENVGPNPHFKDDVVDEDPKSQPIVSKTSPILKPISKPESLPLRTKPKPNSRSSITNPKEKSVRFAPDLDIAPQPEPPVKTELPSPRAEGSAPISAPPDPMKENIIERRPQPNHSVTNQPDSSIPPRKQSRFKSVRQAAATALPTIISNPQAPTSSSDTLQHTSVKRSPISDTLIERPPHPSPSPSSTDNIPNPPSKPSEYDPEIQQRQLESEFFKRRNNLVQKQGGYMRFKDGGVEDEEEVDNDMGDVTSGEGGVKRRKMSLFKAARINGWDP